MKNTLKLFGFIAFVAVINFSMAACGDAQHKSIASIAKFLEKQTGTTAENPASLSVQMNLGNMASLDSNWGQLMDALSNWGGYINLDISACTMSTTVFDPGLNFYDRIVSFVLPDAITGIADAIFDNWTGVPAISVTAKNTAFTVIDGIFYTKDQKTLVRCSPLKEGEVIIPDGVTSIRANAFRGCTRITNVIVPDSAGGNITLSGTYRFQSFMTDMRLTFTNSNFVIAAGNSRVAGTYWVLGNSVTLTLPDGDGMGMTIINDSTLRDEDGDTWRLIRTQ